MVERSPDILGRKRDQGQRPGAPAVARAAVRRPPLIRAAFRLGLRFVHHAEKDTRSTGSRRRKGLLERHRPVQAPVHHRIPPAPNAQSPTRALGLLRLIISGLGSGMVRAHSGSEGRRIRIGHERRLPPAPTGAQTTPRRIPGNSRFAPYGAVSASAFPS